MAQDTTLGLKDLLRVEYARDYDGAAPNWQQTNNMPEVGSQFTPSYKLLGKGKSWIKVGIFGPTGLDLLQSYQTLPIGRAPKLLHAKFLDGSQAAASALENIAHTFCSCGKCPCPHRFAALYLACMLQGHAKDAPEDLALQQVECKNSWWPEGQIHPETDPEKLLLFAESSYLVLKTLEQVNLDSNYARNGMLNPHELGPKVTRNEQLLADSKRQGKSPLTSLINNRKGKN